MRCPHSARASSLSTPHLMSAYFEGEGATSHGLFDRQRPAKRHRSFAPSQIDNANHGASNALVVRALRGGEVRPRRRSESHAWMSRTHETVLNLRNPLDVKLTNDCGHKNAL